MTAHAPDHNPAHLRRIQHLLQLLGDALAEGDCDWSETVAALSYTLATVLDGQPDDERRVQMADYVAHKIEAAGRMRGSMGVPGRMQ